MRSQARRVIEHLLKLEHSAAAEPRAGWAGSVMDARDILQDAVTETLRQDLEEQFDRQYLAARRKAALGLRSYGGNEAAAALPARCPYGVDELLRDDWYPANRHGLSNLPWRCTAARRRQESSARSAPSRPEPRVLTVR